MNPDPLNRSTELTTKSEALNQKFETISKLQIQNVLYLVFNFVTVQHPHLTSPIEGEETFFPRPWWEGLGEGGELFPISGI